MSWFGDEWVMDLPMFAVMFGMFCEGRWFSERSEHANVYDIRIYGVGRVTYNSIAPRQSFGRCLFFIHHAQCCSPNVFYLFISFSLNRRLSNCHINPERMWVMCRRHEILKSNHFKPTTSYHVQLESYMKIGAQFVSALFFPDILYSKNWEKPMH